MNGFYTRCRVTDIPIPRQKIYKFKTFTVTFIHYFCRLENCVNVMMSHQDRGFQLYSGHSHYGAVLNGSIKKLKLFFKAVYSLVI